MKGAIMVKEKAVESKVKVVTLGEYIAKIGNDISGIDKVKAAITLLYSENKIIGEITRKGETYYVAEK